MPFLLVFMDSEEKSGIIWTVYCSNVLFFSGYFQYFVQCLDFRNLVMFALMFLCYLSCFEKFLVLQFLFCSFT
jgi:hypothetical protein